MTTEELCKWLRENSSGVYRPAALAAEEIESLTARLSESEQQYLQTHNWLIDRNEQLADMTRQRDEAQAHVLILRAGLELIECESVNAEYFARQTLEVTALAALSELKQRIRKEALKEAALVCLEIAEDGAGMAGEVWAERCCAAIRKLAEQGEGKEGE